MKIFHHCSLAKIIVSFLILLQIYPRISEFLTKRKDVGVKKKRQTKMNDHFKLEKLKVT